MYKMQNHIAKHNEVWFHITLDMLKFLKKI